MKGFVVYDKKYVGFDRQQQQPFTVLTAHTKQRIKQCDDCSDNMCIKCMEKCVHIINLQSNSPFGKHAQKKEETHLYVNTTDSHCTLLLYIATHRCT